MIMMIRLVESDDDDDQTGRRIIDFRLLCKKVRDSYFGAFWDGILAFGPTQSNVTSKTSDRLDDGHSCCLIHSNDDQTGGR